MSHIDHSGEPARAPGSAPTSAELRSYPGATSPDRRRDIRTNGLRVAVHEWGAADARPLLLAHGGADFARTFDVFAPLLAGGGWRVVAWDHRGHGDSEHAALYSWDADLADALAVLDATARHPIAAVGHSKGGGLLSHLVAALPERFTHFVNIDGIPGKRQSPSHGLDLQTRVAGRARLLERWLDQRRHAHEAVRRPGTIEQLAARRQKVNPRLDSDWLEYLVTVGGRSGPDGWRWKLDPTIRMGMIGPWRPEWGLRGLDRLEVPMLVILGAVEEPMGWGTNPDVVRGQLPSDARLEVFGDSGHFVHIEHPERTANLVLDFLAENL